MAILTHADASISVEENRGKRLIRVDPRPGLFSPITKWESNYPIDLIDHVLRVKGPAYLCDEIMRDESPLYVQQDLHWDILSYFGEEDFAGRRVLDFGSGSGASSMILARMFSDAQIVGVDLVPDYLELARHRARYYGVEDRASFQLSSDSNSLPPGIGEFDYVILSAVYEHLYPNERQAILPLLWSHLKDGGAIILDQTPYRWSPVESHTTDLPFINFLPDRLACAYSRVLSKRVRRDDTWSTLLRKGIRGGTTREILSILNQDGRKAELLEPSHLGVRDRIDLWYQLSASKRRPLTKLFLMWGLRGIRALTGVIMVPMLSLAIRKAH